LQGGLGHVGSVVGTEGFAQDISNPGGLEYCADGFSGNDTGAGRSGSQEDPGTAIGGKHLMRDGGFAEGDADHVTPGNLAGFPNGFCDLASLAESEADAATAIARDHEGAEAEAPAAFDDFGGAIDVDDFLAHFTFAEAFVGIEATSATTLHTAALRAAFLWGAYTDFFSHNRFSCGSLKLESGFTGRVGKRLDFAMVTRAAAVEYDGLNSLAQGGLGGDLTDAFGAGDVGGDFAAFGETFGAGGRRDECLPGEIIDKLNVDMFAGETDAHAGTFGGALDFAANPPMPEFGELLLLFGPHDEINKRCVAAGY
jgi:hypothetical protein